MPMKPNMPTLIPALLCMLALSCSQQKEKPTEVPEQTTEKAPVLFSEGYQPPVFTATDRMQKLQGLASEIEDIYKKAAVESHYPGIVWGVVMDGQLVLSGADGVVNLESKSPVTTRSLFRIASMSKSFTAMAILKLQEEGKLRIDDPAYQYVPEMKDLKYLTQDAPVITIRNLLTMTAGFPEDNPWGDRQLDDTNEELIEVIRQGVSFSNVPSFTYEYSNLGYALLGNIVGRVSGMPYQKYITQNILLPLGLESTRWEYEGTPDSLLALGYRWEDEQWKPEPYLHDGSYGAMGGLITSMDDFHKYVAFHLSAWPPKNGPEEGPVSRATLRAMQTMNNPSVLSGSKNYEGETCPSVYGYGFGLRVSKNCEGLYQAGHSGGLPGFGSNYVFFPECGIGIMSFDNRTYGGTTSINNKVADLLGRNGLLEPRVLPVSEILEKRKKEVMKLITTWDGALEKEILAENFYPDKSREHRRRAIDEVFERAGEIGEVGPLVPLNQLRGTFRMRGENGDVAVFFTLTPEAMPKVQRLDVWFEERTE